MRFHTQPIYAQTLRYYTQSTKSAKADRLGAAVTAGYCCLVAAPFAGAALVSKNAKKDGRYANLYVVHLHTFLTSHKLTVMPQTTLEFQRLPALLSSVRLRRREARVLLEVHLKNIPATPSTR